MVLLGDKTEIDKRVEDIVISLNSQLECISWLNHT